MVDMELVKNNFEAYKNADSLSEQNRIIKELQDIVANATLAEKKEILKLTISSAIDDLFE